MEDPPFIFLQIDDFKGNILTAKLPQYLRLKVKTDYGSLPVLKLQRPVKAQDAGQIQKISKQDRIALGVGGVIFNYTAACRGIRFCRRIPSSSADRASLQSSFSMISPAWLLGM